ncbi:DUF1282 domain-containing protein [Sphingomonas gilva]|uniref:DUF1282 domain-containing protein n=1 Tax=Sphingomonas gilva TaxID=2305907 RepID=A0A396RZG6_9SPHN|nr:Yip1 family protein [Sphingomonas gilva]RHW16495.1 DUF1282 domain-containing protein [Sphingomonas gilva]
MSIVNRAKNILTSPKTEWPIIGAEPATTGGLMTYAAILSGIAQICGIIGALLLSGAMGAVGMGTTFVVASAVVSWLLGLAIIFIMSIIAGALAPSFDGQKDNLSALKLLVYAGTAVWVFSFLSIIPILGSIAALIGFAYAIYLIYLGAPHTVRVPEAKSGGYAAVVVIIWLILYFIITAVVVGALMTGMLGSAAMGGAMSTY